MTDYVSSLLDEVKAKNQAEPEFHQAVQEVVESLALVLERHPEYQHGRIIERDVAMAQPASVSPAAQQLASNEGIALPQQGSGIGGCRTLPE